LSIWGSDDESSDEVELSSTKKRNPLMSNKGSLNPPKVKLGKAAGEDAGPSRIPSKRKQTSGVANITNTDNTDLSPSRKKAKRATQADATDNESDEPSNRNRRQKGSKLSTVSEILEGEGARYRAIKQEQPLLGWLESPCNQCPAFEFCKAGGPVNPKNCLYYNDWMSGGRVSPVFL
jgi:DNA-directed RNA polymerase III subunit RPC6